MTETEKLAQELKEKLTLNELTELVIHLTKN